MASKTAASRIRRIQRTHWQVPIVDRHRRIVGWTSENPVSSSGGHYLRHPQAERLIGDPLICAYVQIHEAAAAERAGAPSGWRDPWRCIAIVSEKAATRATEEIPTLAVTI